ncbi:MAG TPA: hypothetical protein VN736_01135 [Candidatus Limnocylindrales bacterium]|nr:hypothetical protein [Candidatus Limnocylindrales bacterium]
MSTLHYADPGNGNPVISTDTLTDGSCCQYVKVLDPATGTSAPTLYTQAFDYDASGNPIYLGYAVPGNSNAASAVWRILKLTYDGSGRVTNRQYAGGSVLFNQIWNNRATLTYS